MFVLITRSPSVPFREAQGRQVWPPTNLGFTGLALAPRLFVFVKVKVQFESEHGRNEVPKGGTWGALLLNCSRRSHRQERLRRAVDELVPVEH